MSQTNTRRRSSGKKWIPITVLVVAVAGAALGTYALLNDGRMPWTAETQAQAKAQEDRVGKRAYPRAMRAIPAFTAVTMEDFVDEKGEPRVTWLAPEQAKAKGMLETGEVLGRVTKADKRMGYAFTEADFLPKGAPASRTAAIPAGMVGVSISAQQIPTLRGLKANDRFVLVAAADPYSGALAPRGAVVAADAQHREAERKAFDALTKRIVEGGVVIQGIPESKANAKDPAFVAVPQAQYDELLSALNNGVEITALAESTNPTVEVTPLPTPVPQAPPERITIQNGNETKTIVLPPEPKPSFGDKR